MVMHRKPGREGCEGQRIAGMEKSEMHTSKPRRLVNGTFWNSTERKNNAALRASSFHARNITTQRRCTPSAPSQPFQHNSEGSLMDAPWPRRRALSREAIGRVRVLVKADVACRKGLRQGHPARISLLVGRPLRHLHRLQLLRGLGLIGAEVLEGTELCFLARLGVGLDLGHPESANSIAPMARQPARVWAALNLCTVPVPREASTAEKHPLHHVFYNPLLEQPCIDQWKCSRELAARHDEPDRLSCCSMYCACPGLPNSTQCLPHEAYHTMRIVTILGSASQGPLSAWLWLSPHIWVNPDCKFSCRLL